MLTLEPRVVSVWTGSGRGLKTQRAIDVQLSKKVGMDTGETKAAVGGSGNIKKGHLANKARG